MQQFLICLCTLVCTLAGWLLGSHPHAPVQVAAPAPLVSAPAPLAETLANTEPEKLDVVEVLARVRAEFGEQHQVAELSARLFAELQELRDEDFNGAVAAILSSGDRRARETAQLLVGYWAERDLPAARQWVLGLRGSPWIWNVTGAVFDTWTRNDFSGVCDWLEAHADDLSSKDHREAAGFSLAKAAARSDPERGRRLLGTLEPEDAGHSWNLYHEWVRREPLAAANRALREPDGKVRGRAITAIASGWAPRDPTAARAWAEGIPDPIVSRNTVVNIGSVLGSTDPRAGAEYLAQIPQSNEAREALRDTVFEWAKCSLDSAFSWAASLADPRLGDWVAAEVKAKSTPERQAKMEQRWRELRTAQQPNSGPAR